MYKEKGITLISLIVYIIVIIIVIGVMSAITTNFYANINDMQLAKEDILEFNTFNTYFLKEVKASNNKLDSTEGSYILFSSGNSFSLMNNCIYYNDTAICTGVQEFECSKDEQDSNIINVRVKLNNFEKSMKYKIEEIY